MNVKTRKRQFFLPLKMNLNLDELNSEQKEAVMHLNGPMLVIAGAGTGKTRVITYRYCFLNTEKKISLQNILAVTFTDKATKEMSNRITNIIGKPKEDLWVNTFHAFSSKILRNYANVISLMPDFKILNKLEQAISFKKIFDDLELKILRPLNNPYQYFDSLLAYFNRIKEELIGPNEYEYYVNNLEKKGTEPDKIEREKEILLAYKNYEHNLLSINSLDFSSLTFYAFKLLKNNPKILTEYQNQFQYIMVDEYQDTNFAQNEIIKLLAKKHNNIMVVGDDDQSIYKFRGASVANILDFEKTFMGTKKIVLTKNFRSTQSILDLAYTSIQNNNPNRLENIHKINKKLESQVNNIKNDVYLIKAENNILEARGIANKILDLKSENKLNYNNMAILLRSTKNQAENICLALKEKNIPYVIFGESGFFQKKAVKDLLALLGLLNDSDEDIYLYRLLLSSIFNVDSKALKIIGELCKEKKYRLIYLIENPEEIQNNEIIDILKKVKDFIAWLKNTSKESDIIPFIDNIFEKVDYFKNLINSDSEEKTLLNKFKSFAQEFQEKYQVNKLEDFLFYLDLTMKLYEDFSLETDDNIESFHDKINIMTVHKAKGLEFEAVFIGNLAEQRFPTRSRSNPFDIPESLVKEAVPKKEAYLEEERRLFYVAATRAKSHLFLSYAENYGGTRKKKPSIFVEELSSFSFKEENIALKEKKQIKKQMVANNNEPLKLSYTQIDTYETCPLKYKFAYIDHVPYRPQFPMIFGNFIHTVMEKFYNKYKETNIYNKADLLKIIEENWPSKCFKAKKQEKDYLVKTQEMLLLYYEKIKDENHYPLFIEKTFLLKIDNEISLSGRIDLITKSNNNTTEIIDFKSSFKTPLQREIDNDLQMTIYAFVAKQLLNLNPEFLSVYYIMIDEKFNTKRDEKDFEKLVITINDTADKIRNRRFDANTGWHCRFCDYTFICPNMERKY